MNILKIRRKPCELECMQYTGEIDNATSILKWMFPDIEKDAEASDVTIQSIESMLQVNPGDYIIKRQYAGFMSCSEKEVKQYYEIIC